MAKTTVKLIHMAPSPHAPECHYPADPQASLTEYSAVQVVGYDNNKGAWLYKHSWGPNFAMGGYAWVGYNVSGVCTRDDTWGLNFTPERQVWPPVPLVPELGRPGCFIYKAQPGDYLAKLAEWFELGEQDLRQLVLDNADRVQELDKLTPGTSILLCGIKPPKQPASASSSIGPPPAAAAAGVNRTSTRADRPDRDG
jgi:hypothetical protein